MIKTNHWISCKSLRCLKIINLDYWDFMHHLSTYLVLLLNKCHQFCMTMSTLCNYF